MHFSWVLLLVSPHLLTHISHFLSFLLFLLLSTLACSVFQSCPLLSDFAQTRLALGKGSPESALSTPGSPHHEYIMIPPVSIRLPRQHFLSQRPLKMASLPHFWSSIRLYSSSVVILTAFACCLLANKGNAMPLFHLPSLFLPSKDLLCSQSVLHCPFCSICIKHGASGRGCCPVNGQRVQAPNTSLSNLSACQQHMFCKKLPVGARGKDRSCQTREEMLPRPLPHCGGFSNARMFSPEPSLSSSPELQKFELRDPWGTSSSFLFLLFLLLLPLSLRWNGGDIL